MEEKIVFRSRVSVVLLVFIIAVFIPMTIPIYQDRQIGTVLFLGGTLLFCILLFFGMRYIIYENKLVIKIWFITMEKVRIADILIIKRSYNPLSSPAGSLKRMQVRLKNAKYFLISPIREQDFIEELQKINPQIHANLPEKKGIWRIQDWDI